MVKAIGEAVLVAAAVLSVWQTGQVFEQIGAALLYALPWVLR